MKYYKISLLFISMSISLFAQDKNLTVATIRLTKTEAIKDSDLSSTIKNMETVSQRVITDKEKSEVLDQLINYRIGVQAAERDGITISASQARQNILDLFKQQSGQDFTEGQLRNYMKSREVDYDKYVEEARKQLMYQEYIRKKYGDQIQNVSEPTDAEIQTIYDSDPGRFVQADSVRFKQVFIKTYGLTDAEQATAKQRAEDLFDRVKNKNEKIDDLASLYSDDDQSKDKNGDVGFVYRNASQQIEIFGDAFFNELFKQKINQQVMLSSKVGYHIITVTDKKSKRLLTLNDELESAGQGKTKVREIIKNMVRAQKQQDKLKDLASKDMSTLRKQSVIKLFDKNIWFKYEKSS